MARWSGPRRGRARPRRDRPRPAAAVRGWARVPGHRPRRRGAAPASRLSRSFRRRPLRAHHAGSPKRHDLERDGRYALQTFPQPKPGSDEFYVAGKAVRIDDAAARDAVFRDSRHMWDPSEIVFELWIERVMHTRWENVLTPADAPRASDAGARPRRPSAPIKRPPAEATLPHSPDAPGRLAGFQPPIESVRGGAGPRPEPSGHPLDRQPIHVERHADQPPAHGRPLGQRVPLGLVEVEPRHVSAAHAARRDAVPDDEAWLVGHPVARAQGAPHQIHLLASVKLLPCHAEPGSKSPTPVEYLASKRHVGPPDIGVASSLHERAGHRMLHDREGAAEDGGGIQPRRGADAPRGGGFAPPRCQHRSRQHRADPATQSPPARIVVGERHDRRPRPGRRRRCGHGSSPGAARRCSGLEARAAAGRRRPHPGWHRRIVVDHQ